MARKYSHEALHPPPPATVPHHEGRTDDDPPGRRAATEGGEVSAHTPGPWHWEGDYPKGHCPHESPWTDHGPDLIAQDGTCVLEATGHDASRLDVSGGGVHADSLC